jgi:hypothetical protein
MLTDTARATPDREINGGIAVDLEALTEELWVDLAGAVDRQSIRGVLTEVAPTYRDARITTVVRVFVRRGAPEFLRARA